MGSRIQQAQEGRLVDDLYTQKAGMFLLGFGQNCGAEHQMGCGLIDRAPDGAAPLLDGLLCFGTTDLVQSTGEDKAEPGQMVLAFLNVWLAQLESSAHLPHRHLTWRGAAPSNLSPTEDAA